MGGVYHAPAPDSPGFRKLLGFLFGVFTGIGLLFAVLGGCSLHADRAFYASATSTTGEIIKFVSDSEGDPHPIVRYTADGQAYTVRLNRYSSAMRVGDAFTTYYTADAPHQARDKSYLTGTVFLCVGGGFFLLGAVGLGVTALRRTRKQQLTEKGEAVTARVTEVVCAENVRVNGRTPYYIFCETGAVPALAGKRLKSRYVYEPLSQALVGTSVRVYFDSRKPTVYFVDTESLQKTAHSGEASV